jgi:hypothetical protein
MWPFSSDNDSSYTAADYPPPVITGCSSVNYTFHEDGEDQVWREIQKAYDIAKGKPHDKLQRGYTAMQVPFRVVFDSSKELMENVLMAAANIPKGTQVWKDWHYGRFSHKSPKKFYRFLEQLPLKSQCLVLAVSHVSYDGKYVEVTMDEGNYIQEAETEGQVNLDIHCKATRDIKAGERFYMNYTEYVGYEHDIDWFDDLKYNAFREAKLRGASNMASPSAWDKPNRFEAPPSVSPSREAYPSMMWPILAILCALFAIKNATAVSSGGHRRNSDLWKGRSGKLC